MQYHPPSHPLSHHEILGLAAPFARRGLHVDLAASQRLERRLVFKEVPGPDGLREGLRLENPAEGRYLLTRTLMRPDGLQVELQTSGADPAVLLARLDTVPPASQWHTGPGFVLAVGMRVEPQGNVASADAPLRTLATRLELHCDALVLRLQVPATPGIPADLEVEAPQGDVHELPEDLLAVLGQGWSSLWRVGPGWRGSFRLPRREPARSEHARRQMERAGAHLAATLAEPPAQFHARLATARWKVAARRCVPLLGVAALIGASLAVPSFEIAKNSVFRMLIFNAPPLLLALGLCLQELPRFELPRRPRPSTALSWRSAAAAIRPPG
ncbi:MAG TPA: hypothetical protein PKJ32_00510 [Piscinibacter sp.]|nr:hypothetical protein [Piscinibacter sp.]